ncbi:MAG TPA: hypothetical protein PK957_00840 [Candidatus Dojkabacteria bacterium]|nr:hypothetical protein [Candidatus Dojkabacteria bacterium]
MLIKHLISTGKISKNAIICGHLDAPSTSNVDPSRAIVNKIGEIVKSGVSTIEVTQ